MTEHEHRWLDTTAYEDIDDRSVCTECGAIKRERRAYLVTRPGQHPYAAGDVVTVYDVTIPYLDHD